MCGKIRSAVVKSESISVFIKLCSEALFGLSHISFIEVRACQSVHTGLRVFVWCLLVVHL